MKWSEISPHFAPHEVLSPDCIRHPHLICEYALMMLNELRHNWGGELKVNHAGLTMRGVISSRENAVRVEKHGGAVLSTHVQGHAFDVSPRDPTRFRLCELAEEAEKVGFTWIRVYRSWVHVDCRNRITV